MKCTNCGAIANGNFCEYCGNPLKNTNETQQSGNWPIALFIDDDFFDEEAFDDAVEYFAYDVATESETDSMPSKEECLKEIKDQIKESLEFDDEISRPTEADINKDSYVKELKQEYKMKIVYLEI